MKFFLKRNFIVLTILIILGSFQYSISYKNNKKNNEDSGDIDIYGIIIQF